MNSLWPLSSFFGTSLHGLKFLENIENPVFSKPRKVSASPIKISEPLKVGVLVGLEQSLSAGGHVKCWERFAEAATQLPYELDLTIHFLGKKDQTRALSDNVRYIHHRSILSTGWIPFLGERTHRTDLFPIHFRLWPYLGNYDVIHVTDVFSFAQTALRFCRKKNVPLVKSIHTDVVKFSRVYFRQIMSRLTGSWVQQKILCERLGLERALANSMQARLNKVMENCARVWVSNPNDQKRITAQIQGDRFHFLRRGIDKERFHPNRKSLSQLEKLCIPDDRFLLLFVGRVDDSKKVMTLGHAAKTLLDRGHPIHVIIAGKGHRCADLKSLLEGNVSLLGTVPQSQLGKLYATCDLFVFPSRSEVSPNVVLEACASGLPVLVSALDNGSRYVSQPGRDGFLVYGDPPQYWAAAIEKLMRNPKRLESAGKLASKSIHQKHPSWKDVLEQDLMPVWRKAASVCNATSKQPDPVVRVLRPL